MDNARSCRVFRRRRDEDTASPPRQRRQRRHGLRLTYVAVAFALGCLVSAPAAADTTTTEPAPGAAPTVTSQTSTPSDIARQAGVVGSPWDPRSLSAPGGRYLRDATGRVVILHGVNAVYKHAPYELAIAPGQPFDFSAADAAAIAGEGFNLVRLGILWEGIESGGEPNDPDICTVGTPREPTPVSARVAVAYLQRVVGVVDLLSTYHIHTLIDMHQDVYAEAFRGEGAPPWAVCTDDQPIVPIAGRWSRNYSGATLDIAEDHFWQNNVVGNLQGEYDQVWATVAATFRDNPWVVGYDPYNEPYSPQADLVPGSDPPAYVSAAIECFYTGRLHPGLMPGTRTPLRCPATDPALGVVPTIEAADPNHLVFVEPDIYNADGASESLGPMPFPRLVYNVHLYCGHRDPVTGDPVAPAACGAHEATQLSITDTERGLLATSEQPGGPPMFLSEFGATENATVLRSVTDEAAKLQFGWTYWAWKYYDDPTGSSDEPLATADNRLLPQAATLAVPYAEAIAGVPTVTDDDPATQIFTLSYVPDLSIHAPSVIMTTPARYPNGYCATASGATIISPPGASHLLLENLPGSSSVSFHLNPGNCPVISDP